MKFNTLRRALLATTLAIASTAQAASSPELQSILNLYKQGQLAPALERDNAYIQKNPKDAQALFVKGLIFVKQNNLNAATIVFTQLTQDFPELPEPYNNLAVIYAAQGNYDKARYELEMAINTHPSYATAHENLGDLYAKMASVSYDKALHLDAKNTTVSTKLSIIKEIFNPPGTMGARADAHPVYVASQPESAPHSVAPVVTTPIATVATTPQAATPTVSNASVSVHNTNAMTAETSTEISAVNNALTDWAKAWSAQQADTYLAAYAPAFDLPNGLTRNQWEALRRTRITTPKSIDVQLNNIQVTPIDASHVNVTLVENYHSDRFNSTDRKRMRLEKIGGKWLIDEEVTY